MLSSQWFVKMGGMAAKGATKFGETKVADFNGPAVVDEEIPTLKVSMDDVSRVLAPTLSPPHSSICAL